MVMAYWPAAGHHPGRHLPWRRCCSGSSAPMRPRPPGDFTAFVLACFIGWWWCGTSRSRCTRPDERDQRHLQHHCHRRAGGRSRRPKQGERAPRRADPWLASAALVLTVVNMFGGFAVTRRMPSPCSANKNQTRTIRKGKTNMSQTPRWLTSAPPSCSSSARVACPTRKPAPRRPCSA